MPACADGQRHPSSPSCWLDSAECVLLAHTCTVLQDHFIQEPYARWELTASGLTMLVN